MHSIHEAFDDVSTEIFASPLNAYLDETKVYGSAFERDELFHGSVGSSTCWDLLLSRATYGVGGEPDGAGILRVQPGL